ncbi:hypothetical protein BDV19DRAFT_384818 [Aspergillus venezuelensis]
MAATAAASAKSSVTPLAQPATVSYRTSRPALAARWSDQPDVTAGSSSGQASETMTAALASASAPAPANTAGAAADPPARAYSPKHTVPIPALSIPRYISTTCSDASSLSFFFHHHVLIVDRSPCGGHLAFLPEFYREKQTHPCLHYSILSLGYLSLFNVHESPVFWIEARKKYSAALAALAAAIDTTQSAVRDEVFASALLLGIFSDMSNERKTPMNEHIRGVHALIQARGSASLSGKYGRRLLAWAFQQLKIQSISHNEYGYTHLPYLFEEVAKPDSVQRALKLVSLISGFCQPVTDSTQLTYHPYYILNEIAYWEEKLPGHWKRQLHNMKQGNLAQSQDPSSRNTWTACFLALINSSILLFHLKCLQYPAGCLSDGSYVYPHNIRQLIGEILNTICSAVRYSMGDLHGDGTFQPLPEINHGVPYNLLWPMSLVVECRFALDDQVLLCRQAMGYNHYATIRRT